MTETEVSDTGKTVFDTNWVINHLKGRHKGTAYAETKRYISVVTRIELYGFPGITTREKEEIAVFLKDVMVFPLNDKVEQTAIEVRRRYRRKTPDAVIAATAMVLGATLVSGDGHLSKKHIPGLPVIFAPSPPSKVSWRTTFARNKSLWIALACFIFSTVVFAILFILTI